MKDFRIFDYRGKNTKLSIFFDVIGFIESVLHRLEYISLFDCRYIPLFDSWRWNHIVRLKMRFNPISACQTKCFNINSHQPNHEFNSLPKRKCKNFDDDKWIGPENFVWLPEIKNDKHFDTTDSLAFELFIMP